MNPWILREICLSLFLDNRLELFNECLEIITFKARVIKHTAVEFRRLKRILKQTMINAHDNISIHLNETAVAVIGKTRIIGACCKPGSRLVIQAKIENSIHHARH